MGTRAESCPGENELVDYLAHAPGSAAVEAHLDACPACRAAVAQLLDVASLPEGAVATQPLAEEEPGVLLARGARVGRYVVLEVVGAGAMGTVYAARDPDLERTVALKLLRPELGRGPRAAELRARLAREARALARISHPNVITVLDTGAIGDQLFVAMELVIGGTLRAWLQEAPRSWREVLGAYVAAGSGLAAAHAAGIVHRDFKPDNVLVGGDGRVRVTDFGLSLGHPDDPAPGPGGGDEPAAPPSRASVTATGVLLGTPAYMAPEQLAGSGADARSDLFSFCVALHEGLYGERPFGGATLEALRRSSGGPVPAAPAGTEVPPWIRRVLLRGLRADPAARYPSMEALIDALSRDPARARRRAGVGVLAVALLGAAAVSGWSARAPRSGGGGEVRRAAGGEGASAALAPPGCTDNRGCIAAHGGQPAICRKDDGVCVTLASEDCRVLAEPGDLADDATIWVGAMFPVTGADAPPWGLASTNAVDLARRDFAEIDGGLPPARPGGPRRPIAVVACDDRVDAERAAQHLVDEVRVPAVIGFGRSREVISLASALFIPRDVLALAANTASMLRTIPRAPGAPRLVWRTTISADQMMQAIASAVSAVIEPEVRAASGVVRAGEPIRVALVRVGNPSGQSLADLCVAELRFNGRSVLENGEAFRQIVVPDPFDTGRAPDLDRIRDEIVAFEPHLVIGAGGLDSALLVEIERAWPATRRGRPRYVVDSLDRAETFSLVRERPEARGRLFATEPVSSTPFVGRFALRYNELFSPKVTPETASGAPYDAFYLFAYAAAAVGDRPLGGAALARALPRLLPPGEPVDVGPGGIHAALAALGSGRSIDLRGTTTSLDFDLDTGDAPADFALHCIGGAGHSDARDIIEALVLDPPALRPRPAALPSTAPGLAALRACGRR